MSPALQRFPFPFDADTYRYSANVEPAPCLRETVAGGWGDTLIHVDEGYEAELAERARILAADPSRCCALPHMRAACWDTLMWGLRELTATYPASFSLERVGLGWRWRNRRLGVEQTFTYGVDDSLPVDPLRYVGSQLQEDLVLLDQREGALWADAGLVTFAADWSMRFDLGMAFIDIHRPVPRLIPQEIIPRAQQFLLRLETDQSYRRLNWTVTATPRLDLSTETYHEWGRTRRQVTESDTTDAIDEVGERLHLRVEVQHFVRLAPSGAILFPIRTYLLRFDELAQVPQWRARTASVLSDLPRDMADYKGISRFHDRAVAWLTTSPGSP